MLLLHLITMIHTGEECIDCNFFIHEIDSYIHELKTKYYIIKMLRCKYFVYYIYSKYADTDKQKPYLKNTLPLIENAHL
jgi:hypothetical protein